MATTYLALNIHYVFSTKNREKFLIDDILDPTHRYLAGIVKGLGATPLQIGGIDDHVHILLRMRATHSVAGLIQEIKKSGTHWLQEEMNVSNFHWQDGYAAVSVSPHEVAKVSAYIANQREHHHKMTFEEERLEFLRLGGIEFDPRYMD